MLGNWIDSLTDEERDRIVADQDWTWRGFYRSRPTHWPLTEEKQVILPPGRCLVSHVCDWHNGLPMKTVDKMDAPDGSKEAFRRFDDLCDRFGLNRVVRAIKLRAGATLSDLPQPEQKAVGAHRG